MNAVNCFSDRRDEETLCRSNQKPLRSIKMIRIRCRKHVFSCFEALFRNMQLFTMLYLFIHYIVLEVKTTWWSHRIEARPIYNVSMITKVQN